MSRLVLSLVTAFFGNVFLASGSTTTINWSSVTWPTGSLSQTYSNVVITISGSTSALNSSTSPAIAGNLGGTGRNSLQIAPTFTLATQSLTVTINFSAAVPAGVYLRNLNILSIDSNSGANWVDRLTTIQGTLASGGTVNAVAVAGSSSNSVTGNASSGWVVTGTGTVGGTSASGNVSVSFGNDRVKQISFTFLNQNVVLGGAQLFGLDNITFDSTPEVLPGLIGAVFCGLVLTAEFWRNRRRRAPRAPTQ